MLDQVADEVEVRLGCRREADLDLLVSDVGQELEHQQLPVRGHRIDEGLIAVAKIGAEPTGGLVDALRRPGAVRHVDRHEGGVAMHGHRRGLLNGLRLNASHDCLPAEKCCASARQFSAARRPARSGLGLAAATKEKLVPCHGSELSSLWWSSAGHRPRNDQRRHVVFGSWMNTQF